MKSIYLLVLFSFLLAACSNSSNYDGLWLIEKEKSTTACLLSIQDEQEKDVSEENNFFGENFLEGFSKLLCEGVTSMIPVLEIKNNQFNYSVMGGSATCTINPTKHTVSCLPEDENKNLIEDGSPLSMSETAGEIKIDEGLLIWNMSQEVEENVESKEFKLFYKRRE